MGFNSAFKVLAAIRQLHSKSV